jgi:hypothetical protein
MRFLRSFLFPLLISGPAWSEQVSPWLPGGAVERRSNGLWLVSSDRKLARFYEWMRYDPSGGVRRIEAGTQEMSSETIRDRITGREMMDVMRFPDTRDET